jgi:hypothetical protein
MVAAMNPNFTYMQTTLNRYTFSNKRIKKWVEDNCEGLVLNLFAGKTKLNLAETRVDSNPDMLADYHMDALQFLRDYNYKTRFSTVLLDPPYAYRKSMEMYEGHVASPFKQLKDEIPKVLHSGGIVITFGYHSVSMGKGRGFEVEHILLMSHGGAIHDTIATIERYV